MLVTVKQGDVTKFKLDDARIYPVVKFSRNRVPPPVSAAPTPEIAVPPPKVVVPPSGNGRSVTILGKIIKIVATRGQILRLK